MKKKRIPECNDAYKEALVQKVLDADVVYEWEHILIDKHRWVGCIPGVLFGVVFAFLTRETPLFSFLMLVWIFLMCAFMYFIGCASRDYLCQITPYGIRDYKTEQVPEVFYKATRVVAYVGIAVCVIAVIFVGPMAFVGAGGSALMAFQMRNFHKNTEVMVKPFDSNGIYEYNPNDNPPEESCFKNGITRYDYVIPEYLKNGDENLTALKNFHWISFFCTQEQYPEIHDVIARYITATLEKDEEEAVTQ